MGYFLVSRSQKQYSWPVEPRFLILNYIILAGSTTISLYLVIVLVGTLYCNIHQKRLLPTKYEISPHMIYTSVVDLIYFRGRTLYLLHQILVIHK